MFEVQSKENIFQLHVICVMGDPCYVYFEIKCEIRVLTLNRLGAGGIWTTQFYLYLAPTPKKINIISNLCYSKI